MSSAASKNDQIFESIEEEATYWENRSKDHIVQVLRPQARVRQLESKRLRESSLNEDHEEDPAKKSCIDIIMDPFVDLPEHITEKILNHLNGMDFYNMTEVSRGWKIVVESDKRAAYQLKEILTLDTVYGGGFMEIRLKLLNFVEYKHLVHELNLFGKASIERFSSTIESLEIHRSKNQDIRLLGLTFPRLKSLCFEYYDSTLYELFSNCKFPVLGELSFNHHNGYKTEEKTEKAMKKMLAAMPRLKHLRIKSSYFSMTPFKEELMKLESLKLKKFTDEIFKVFSSSSLHTLKIDSASEHEVDLIFSRMKNLKNFATTIDLSNDKKKKPLSEMSTNTSITSLEIIPYNYSDTTIISKMLKALPSLEKFRYESLGLLSSTFEVIVHNNMKMKQIVCKYFNNAKTLKKYEELKVSEADNDKINTNIEIVYYKSLNLQNYL